MTSYIKNQKVDFVLDIVQLIGLLMFIGGIVWALILIGFWTLKMEMLTVVKYLLFLAYLQLGMSVIIFYLTIRNRKDLVRTAWVIYMILLLIFTIGILIIEFIWILDQL